MLIASLAIVVARLSPETNAFDRLVRFYSRVVLSVCGVRLVVKGSQQVDFSRHFIYVANHASLLDIPAAIAGIPDNIRIVYKKELNFIPFLGWGLKLSKKNIPIDRAKGHEAVRRLEDAIKRVLGKASILLFAEGTRTPDGRLQPFKRGAFNLAVRANVPVVPLTIIGSHQVLSKHSFRINPGTITLILDKPVEPTASNGKSAENRLMEEVRAIIEHHFST